MEDWERAARTKGEHYEMYQAIVSGNAELAEDLTAKHIVNAKKHMMEEMQFHVD
jgi:DNA-binding GntR family transcriptional regulator